VQWRRDQSRYQMSTLDFAWLQFALGYGGSEVTGDGRPAMVGKEFFCSSPGQLEWAFFSGLFLESSPPTTLEALNAQSFLFTYMSHRDMYSNCSLSLLPLI
jgi:hypothetical protein